MRPKAEHPLVCWVPSGPLGRDGDAPQPRVNTQIKKIHEQPWLSFALSVIRNAARFLLILVLKVRRGSNGLSDVLLVAEE